MSHVADVGLVFEDLDCAEQAAIAHGGVLVRGQQTFKWFGAFYGDWHDATRAAALKGRDPKTFGKCEHVIKLKDAHGDAYEIGLVRRADGRGWDALYDAWGPGQQLEHTFGKDLRNLKQEYGAQVALKRLRRQGYRLISRTTVDGKLHVKVGR